MITREYTHIDKSAWPDGPWKNEPDKVQWQDASTKLPCLIVRHSSLGHWCGYVGVTKDHPLYGSKDECDFDLSVHGGITFTDRCSKNKPEYSSICHIPDANESDDVWWLGFDAAHFNDYSPGINYRTLKSGKYRDINYMKSQCVSLAKQLAR